MTPVPLADILLELDSGGRPQGGANGLAKGVASIGAEHLDGSGGFNLSNTRWIPEEFYDQMPKGHVKRGNILIVKDGATTGKTSYVDERFPFERAAVNEHVFRLAVQPRCADSAYVFHYLASPRGQREILKDFRGATVGGISRGFASKVCVPLPCPDDPKRSLAEQKRIAAILDKADVIRRRRHEAARLTEQLIPSLFYDMFGDPVTNPKGWQRENLDQVAQLDRGRSRHRPRDWPPLYGGPYPLIQTGDIANCNGVIREFTQTYSEEGLAQSKLWPKGTLCITIAANIGMTGILAFDACFPDSVVGLVAGKRVTIEYVREWFVGIQKSLDNSAPQVAQKNINLAILNALQIPVPPRKLQEQFAQIVGEVRESQGHATAVRQSTDDLFNSLVQRAFRGEL